MDRILDLSKTVFELCREYPEVKTILEKLGFSDIGKPMALQTVGRVMTIPKGVAIKGFDLTKIISEFESHGFRVINGEKRQVEGKAEKGDFVPVVFDTPLPDNRKALLQSYIQRLTQGEDLEAVRVDFIKHFRGVDPEEIAEAEQQLIRSGIPIRNVQRMCDVHSALFHGAIVENALSEGDIDSKTMTLVKEEGHPLNILYQEDIAIDGLIHEVLTLLAEKIPPTRMQKQIQGLQTITHHFSKKGDLLYPLLRSHYGIDAPYNVMWGVDDEIRNELHAICKNTSGGEEWIGKMKTVLQREEEMIFKEINILFSLCANHFTDDDWQEIRTEMDGYRPAVIDGYPAWPKHQHTHPLYKANETTAEVRLSSGHLSPEQLKAMLDTMPYEITFIDEHDINRYFNEQRGEKLFKRPLMALDRQVFDCHPPLVQPMVRKLLESFHNGTSNSFEVWTEKGGHDVLIRYLAVRDNAGKFLGTLECVQVMDFARQHYSSSNK